MNLSAASGVHNGFRTCGLSCRRRPLCPLSYVDCFFTMAGTERFELPNDRVRASCHTAKMRRHHYNAFSLAEVERIELPSTVLETDVLPLYDTPLVLVVGFEPTTFL